MTSAGRRSAVATAVAGAAFGGYWITTSPSSQLLGAFPNRGHTAARVVALTFDDGPNEPFTGRLVDILRQREVRATFFQVGRAVARDPDSSRALLDAGHTLGNHSYSHEMRRCFAERHIEAEVARTQDVFGELLGHRPRLYRPPWLIRTPATFRVLRRHGLQPVSGTFCHSLEVAGASGARIARRAIAGTAPGRIIIFHDGYNGTGADRSRTLDAVARTIDALAADDWTFTTVDQMLAL